MQSGFDQIYNQLINEKNNITVESAFNDMHNIIIPHFEKVFNNVELSPTQYMIKEIRTTQLDKFLRDISLCFLKIYMNRTNYTKQDREKSKEALLNIVTLFFTVFKKIVDYGIAKGYKLEQITIVSSIKPCNIADYYLEEDMISYLKTRCDESQDPARIYLCSQTKQLSMIKNVIETMLVKDTIDYYKLEELGKELEQTFTHLLPSFIQYFCLNMEYYYNTKLLCAIKFIDQQIQVIENVLFTARQGQSNRNKNPSFNVLKY